MNNVSSTFTICYYYFVMVVVLEMLEKLLL